MSTPFAYTLTLYDDAHDSKYADPVKVPLKIATKENIEPYGALVYDYENEEVGIEVWPTKGWRKCHPATGKGGGVTEGFFKYSWKGDFLGSVNESCPQDGPAGIGRLVAGSSTNKKTYFLTREANYHPDGEQIFQPNNSGPFVALLALPDDDVKPEDFVAFYFDGSCGLKIKSCVWHQAMIPLNDAVFDGKQGKVHGCVLLDTVKEHGKYMCVPMQPEMAEIGG